MNILLLGTIILLLVLWIWDRIRLVARLKEGRMRKEEIDAMETSLNKERKDAVAELNAIQSRLILFMKLESEVIERERHASMEASSKAQELKKQLKKMEKEKEFWNANIHSHISQVQEIATEKTLGFPWLARAYADFFHLQDLKVADAIKEGSPAQAETAGKIVEISRQKKALEEKSRMYQYLLEYYETLFPWLPEFRTRGFEEIMGQDGDYYVEEFLHDPISFYVKPEEMKDRSHAEIFQLALDRYFGAPLSRVQTERNLEQCVLYPWESAGGDVFLFPLLEEYPKLGRFFLVRKGETYHFLQIFCGASDQVVHQPRVLFLFGLVLRKLSDLGLMKRPGSLGDFLDLKMRGTVQCSLYANGTFSESAQDLCTLLGLNFFAGTVPRKFPPVKCVTHQSSGNKTFTLPFDQDFYFSHPHRIKTDCFVNTVKEAEDRGYKRLSLEEPSSRNVRRGA